MSDPQLWIAFSWTSAPLRAYAKDVTRRDWDADYARRFRKGALVGASDRQRRFGGKRIGLLEMTQDAYYESEALMPDRDYAGEGFAWLDAHPEYKPTRWKYGNLYRHFLECREAGESVWVVRFKILEIDEPLVLDGTAKRAETAQGQIPLF